MKRAAVVVPLIVAAVYLARSGRAAPTPPAQPPDKLTWSQPTMSLAQSGIVGGWLDPAADPCKDFFQYACGGFTKSAVIPPDRDEWGAIAMVTRDNEELLKKQLEADAAAKSADPVTAKLGSYYAACMDETAIEQAGIKPIQPLLDQIAQITDVASANRALIAAHQDGSFAFFYVSPTQDFADATQVIAGFDQAGLGLPERKYYLDNTDTIPKTRAAYRAHLERMFALLGEPAATAKTHAADAMRIETAIAKVQQADVVRREPHNVYHRVERVGLEKLAPGLPWGDYLTALGIGGVTAITVNSPTYFTAIDKLIAHESPAALRAYLTSVVLRAHAPELGKAWVDEDFAMKAVLRGFKELPPRWRRCVMRVDNDLGELLAQGYVKERFSPAAKLRATELVKAILGAMRVELDNLAWMDAPTRVAAKAKLDKMAYLVGFPDRWRVYDFEVSRADFARNAAAARAFELHRQLAKIGKPVDRYDWEMSPPTVNAYYEPTLNEIALPAGQLQPPFFGATFHPAVNFASAGGGTIGHEMTHAFDDEGSQFDPDGNLRDWWSATTKAKFGAATKCVVDQYSTYEAVPGVKLNGKLTAGENIADIGGVKIGFAAYQAWKAQQTTPPPAMVEGHSDDQLYFIAYGQSWCEKDTPERLRTNAHANPHSPAFWRVNGVIVDEPGFATAFKCPVGSPMNPGKTCAVW